MGLTARGLPTVAVAVIFGCVLSTSVAEAAPRQGIAVEPDGILLTVNELDEIYPGAFSLMTPGNILAAVTALEGSELPRLTDGVGAARSVTYTVGDATLTLPSAASLRGRATFPQFVLARRA